MTAGRNKRRAVAALFLISAAAPLWAGKPASTALSPEHFHNPQKALAKQDEPWELMSAFLEAGEREAVREFLAGLRLPRQADVERRARGLLSLYEGDYEAARQALAEVSKPDPWTLSQLDYLERLRSAGQGMVENPSESEHFRVRTPPEDAFLVPYVSHALENAHSKMTEVFNLHPDTPVVVEIYPTEDRFSRASTLPADALERSGAIGICKFRRLMILSPRATPLGYRWLDALAHEYNHYLINDLSGGLCPLWLHEGTARYFETAWRRSGPFEHPPASETLLAKAARSGDEGAPALIPFARMEPSMVYLENQEQVSLAFAQVSDAVAYLVERFGPDTLTELLKAFRRLPRAEAFQEVLGMSEADLELAWRDSLKDRDWSVSEGAMGQKISLKAVNESEFLGPDAQGHIQLGDRLRQQDQMAAAILQYKKALEKEPDNGVALVKLARAQLNAGDEKAAEEALRRAVEKNPYYVTPFVFLGELLFDQGRYEEAQVPLQEALEMNPYHPRVHETLGLIALDVGHFPAARKSLELALRFDPNNAELREVLRRMPKDK